MCLVSLVVLFLGVLHNEIRTYYFSFFLVSVFSFPFFVDHILKMKQHVEQGVTDISFL